jgi:hypothetical protein
MLSSISVAYRRLALFGLDCSVQGVRVEMDFGHPSSI